MNGRGVVKRLGEGLRGGVICLYSTGFVSVGQDCGGSLLGDERVGRVKGLEDGDGKSVESEGRAETVMQVAIRSSEVDKEMNFHQTKR